MVYTPWLVSIHARHYWRARPLDGHGAWYSHKSFNPRPPLLAGETAISRRLSSIRSFQSTPAITGGRDSYIRDPWAALTLFQSTPAITGGRDKLLPATHRPGAVSIHARHYWRARRLQRRIQAQDVPSFNPRPPLLAGETPCSGNRSGRSSCFNPRPPLLAGETRSSARLYTSRDRFNPRPPLLAGETPHRYRQPPTRGVSIHARHYWRARLWRIRKLRIARRFQSTPAITGGRDQKQSHHQTVYCGFNPRPPLLAGETRALR